MKPVVYTCILAIFGAITFLPLMMAQLIMLFEPKSQQAKDLIIGKWKEWHDYTHFRSALAHPKHHGVFNGQLWGFFLYWGIGVVVYSMSIII